MPSKKELHELLDSMGKTSFTKGEVKSYIQSIGGSYDAPSVFKKGDVIANGVGAKKRPCVVVKVLSDYMYAIPLSTTQDSLNLCDSSSRFFGDGWFSRSVSVIETSYAKDNFIGVYDNNKALNNAITLIKQELSKL